MKKSVIGIVLIAAALCVGILGICSGGSVPANQEIIKSAVYLADGKVLPENEGQVVIVNGTLKAALPFVDRH